MKRFAKIFIMEINIQRLLNLFSLKKPTENSRNRNDSKTMTKSHLNLNEEAEKLRKTAICIIVPIQVKLIILMKT